MAEKRPTPVKPLTIYFYHTRLTRESYEEWKDYKFPGHILYGLPLLEKYGIRDAETIQVSVSILGSNHAFKQQPAPWIITGRC